MKNVSMSVEGETLVIKVNLSERHGESKSGKSLTVCSTGGNIKVPGFPEISLGLNAYASK